MGKAIGHNDLILQAEKHGTDDVPLTSPVPRGAEGSTTPLPAGEAPETEWMLVGHKSMVDYRTERLYRMLEFSQRGFRTNSPSLAKFDKDANGKDSEQSTRLHDKDRY